MRSISLLSAALCGVLWISLNAGGVVAQESSPTDCRPPYCTDTSVITPTIITGRISASTPTSTPASTESSGISGSTSTSASPTDAKSPTLASAANPGILASSSTSTSAPPTDANRIPTSTSAPTTAADSGSIGNSAGSITTQTQKNSKKKSNTGPIVGGVVGGIVALALILGAAFFLWRRRRRAAAGTEDFGVLEKHRASSPSVYPTTGISAYDTPSPAPQLSPAPAITSVESHHLMGGYPESGLPPQAEIAPVVGAANPYATNTRNEVDDDGVSLRCPSPVHDGANPAGERDSVPRLPIYNRSAGDTTDRGPAL